MRERETTTIIQDRKMLVRVVEHRHTEARENEKESSEQKRQMRATSTRRETPQSLTLFR